MRYLIQKSPIPIVWLDTSIIIKFTKIRIGRGVNRADAERLSRLNEVLVEKVHDKKLVCPVAHQREEYERKDIVEECFRTQEHLAMGVQFLPAMQIQQLQRRQALEAFIQKQSEISLSYVDAFANDPVAALFAGERVQSRYIETPVLVRNQAERMNNWGAPRLEALKDSSRKSHISYEEQLSIEYQGIFQAIEYFDQEWRSIKARGAPKTSDDFTELVTAVSHQINIMEPLRRLIVLAGGQENFDAFLRSDYYKQIPYVDISCRMFAYLVTNKPHLRRGDRADIDQLSVVIPYVDIVMTDKDMVDALKKTGVSESYPFEGYSMTTSGQLEERLALL